MSKDSERKLIDDSNIPINLEMSNIKLSNRIKRIEYPETKIEQEYIEIEEDDFHEKQAAKYISELKKNEKIPKAFKNLYDISPKYKNLYVLTQRKIRVIDSILCFTGILAIILAMVDNNIIITGYNFLAKSFILFDINNAIRIINIIINLYAVILIIKRYDLLLNIHKLKYGPIADKDTLISTKLIYLCVIEVTVNIISVPPFVEDYFSMKGSILVDYDFTSWINIEKLIKEDNLKDKFISKAVPVRLYYNITSILTFFILFRFYHFFRVVFSFSDWNTPRANAICGYMNTNADIFFGIRAYLKIYPFFTISFSVVLVIVIFGLGEYLFENYNSTLISLISSAENSTNYLIATTMKKFSNIYNSYWLVLVTMTTIGYGDIYPTTYFGRILAICACIFGTFVLSLLIVFLNNIISFTEGEKKVYDHIEEENFNPVKMKRDAVSLLSYLLKYNYLIKKKPHESSFMRLYYLIEMKYSANSFKSKRLSQKRVEINIEGILTDIRTHMLSGISPFKLSLENYNKTIIANDTSLLNLKDTKEISEKMANESLKMWNLLKVLNKGKCLKNLKKIDEVYDYQANILEEILFHHENNIKKSQIIIEENSCNSHDNDSDFSMGSNSDEKISLPHSMSKNKDDRKESIESIESNSDEDI